MMDHPDSIAETFSGGMVVIDRTGIIRSFNPAAARLFGYEPEELIGRNLSMLIPAPDQETHGDYILRSDRAGEDALVDTGRALFGERKDGSVFPIEFHIGAFESGGTALFAGFVRDLTRQRQLEARLQELQAEIYHLSRFSTVGEMASTLAHEINQPLTAINNYLRGSHRLLQRLDGEPGPALREALARAADQALRAGEIIRRLREFVARGDSERTVENLAKLIEDSSMLALVGTRENAIAVSFRLDPRAEQVLVDRVQIQQVLVNLIRNAVDVLMETPGNRELAIETLLQEDGTVRVSVGDSGPGLAPVVREHLFQPFVTTKQKGMGLGLSICRTIIEAHGGRIWVDDRPGGGTIFRFTLRQADERSEETELGQ